MPKKEKLQLLKALEFMKPAQDKEYLYTRLHDGWATAFNRIIACGHPIVEDLSICVNTKQMTIALKEFSQSDSITQQQQELKLRVGDMVANIPTVNPASIEFVTADREHLHPISDELQKALKLLSGFISAADTVFESSVMVDTRGSAFGGNNEFLVEVFHNCILKQQVILPQTAVTAIGKVTSPGIALGYGDKRLTFFFDDDSWIRTQHYDEAYPRTEDIFKKGPTAQLWALPDDFFDKLKAILPTATENRVYMCNNALQTDTAIKPLVWDLPDVCVDGKKLLKLKGHVHSILLEDKSDYAHFYGDRVRAICVRKA